VVLQYALAHNNRKRILIQDILFLIYYLSQWNLDVSPFSVNLFCYCERRIYFAKQCLSFYSIAAYTFLRIDKRLWNLLRQQNKTFYQNKENWK
jgi:hypothetical protein